MSDPGDPHAELLDELRSLVDRVDPVPPDVTEFAQAALGWRRLDADLAELLADSALETDAVALARGGEGRWLTFRADDLTIDVEIQIDGDSRTLLGQLAPPPAAATVEAQSTDGTVVASAESDELGRFRLSLAVEGHVRLRVLREGAAPVETSWFSV
jgi:hypothetical protein